MITQNICSSGFIRKRLVAFLRTHSLLILIVLGIISLIISCYGLSLSFQDSKVSYTLFDLIYISLQLFVLESGSIPSISNIWIQIARFLAPAIAAATFLLLITVIFIDYFRSFRLRYFVKDHVIVCGLGYLGPVIAEYFRKLEKDVVLIELNSDNTGLSRCKEQGIFTLTGDASDPDLLKRAKVTNAERIFLVTGSDAKNAEIAIKSMDIIKSSKRIAPFICHTHIVDQNLCNVLRNHQIGLKIHQNFVWEFFNLYQIGGYCIQKAYPPGGNRQLPEDLRVLVIGVGRMGETLIVQLAKRWKEQYANSPLKCSLTIIDKNADDILGLILLRHPSLEQFCSIQAISYTIPSTDFALGDFLFDENNKTFHQIYICISDSSVGLSAALQINTALGDHHVPIVVRTTYLEGTTRLFQTFQEGCSEYSHIFAFPLVSCKCCHELIMHGFQGLMARMIHDDYRNNRIREGKNPDEDPALVLWHLLDETYRRANLEQARHIFTKIQTLGYGIIPLKRWDEELFTFNSVEIEKLAAMEHERWNLDRIADGWIYGPERNKEKKITPYLIPYDKLPDEIKEYDRETVRNIPRLLGMMDLTITRECHPGEEDTRVFYEFKSVCQEKN